MARLTYSLCIQRSNLVKGLPPPAADPRRSQAGILQPPTCGSIQSRTLSLELYIYIYACVRSPGLFLEVVRQKYNTTIGPWYVLNQQQMILCSPGIESSDTGVALGDMDHHFA